MSLFPWVGRWEEEVRSSWFALAAWVVVGATGCGGDERPPGCFVCDLSLFDCTLDRPATPLTGIAAVNRLESYGCTGSMEVEAQPIVLQIRCDTGQVCFDEGGDGRFDCTPVALGVNTFSWAKNATDTWTCVAR